MLACPSCTEDTCYERLEYRQKHVHMGHRRFLECGHRVRCVERSFHGGIVMRYTRNYLQVMKFTSYEKKKSPDVEKLIESHYFPNMPS